MPASENLERARVKDLPLTRLLPNLLTLLSLCSGLTGIRFALQEKWQEAVMAIVIAAVFDVLDGRVARLLNIASKFGAELDSLSDAISFGVAPGFIMYQWTLQDDKNVGWISVLVYAVCSALRLARFNTMLEDNSQPAWAKSYFTGVPAPAGAGLALLPLMLVLAFGTDVQWPPMVIAFWLLMAGGLMVSRMPTLSLKGLRVAPVWVAPIMMAAVLLIAGIATHPWFTLSLASMLYFASLPLGWINYRLRQIREAKSIVQ